jgi:tryptophan halogenase
MRNPDTLAQKIEIFRGGGRIHREHEELFTEESWTQVLIGQEVMPGAYHPLVDAMPARQIREMVAGVRGVLERSADAMPSHAEYIARHCKAESAGIG